MVVEANYTASRFPENDTPSGVCVDVVSMWYCLKAAETLPREAERGVLGASRSCQHVNFTAPQTRPPPP
jgi:hypothetical protein